MEEANPVDDADAIADALAQEAAELDGYFSDADLDPQPVYPPIHETFETAIVITNLPRVPEAKLAKLSKVVVKLVSRIGPLAASDDADENGGEPSFSGVYMPFDKESGTTCGFCFVEYQLPEHAQNAVDVLQAYKFDKNHALSVCRYPRAQELDGVAVEAFETPPAPALPETPVAHTWLQDAHQRDQYVTRFGNETVVHWYDAKNDPVTDYDGWREKEAGVQWCEYYCHWSPMGSYLATLVPARGVILWAGADFFKSGRFVAPGVKVISFSPCENYLLCNSEHPDDPAACKVYHIRSGKLLRAFPMYPPGVATDQPPPPFLWSHDGNYLARQGVDLVSIYEAPSMRLLDKRSLSTPGICEFQWSPAANVLAYWAPEAKNAPAHVDLIEIPSRKPLRQRNLFNVTGCNMVFQQSGEYLAVKVTRHTKSKKTLYNNIELFRLSESGIPVEMLDLKDAVMALQWEPKGSRFAMIHAENPDAAKVTVSFYDMQKRVAVAEKTVVGAPKKKNAPSTTLVKEVHLVESLEGRQCNTLFWSPAGGMMIMASLGDSASGTLEFYDVDTKAMVVKEHYRANQVLWDPSGRTVATLVSQPIGGGHFKFAMDNGYILWSFQGKQLYQQSFETFYQFIWRPRPSLLSKSQVEKVKRNWKKYEKQFDKADRKRQRALYLEQTKGKRMQRSAFRELLGRNKALRTKRRAEYLDLLGGYDSDDEANYVTRQLQQETVLSVKEEVVGM